ncbi:serine hydrolase domain-containing protein [Psychrobacillus sp. NPDC058041]|uniref:serine hydrolase domain-containing protein n=1 Tax=Psychrobacillus sp. NPDC058041 TaxID=3346310 RepID=UPI0036DE6883
MENFTETEIVEMFRRTIKKDSNIHNAYLLVHSDKQKFHLKIAEGETGSMSAHVQQPFFIASISKLFTSTLIALLVEGRKVSYDDLISEYIEGELLSNLHVYKGKEYTQEIKIKQLLNHTSGLQDHFEDKPKAKKSLLDELFDDPTRVWTPKEVILWSKENLHSHFPPGKGFHYSDTGYHLLGLIIEKITSMPLHEAFHHYIFEPLQMNHSYLFCHPETAEKNELPIAHLFGRNRNVTDYASLTIASYAGGGIVSTLEDLLTFMRKLSHGDLLKNESFERMKDWSKFSSLDFLGIDYGYGLASFKIIPLIMPKKYRVFGNFGSTGTFMFYHPEMDIYFIGALNHFGYGRKGIKVMFKSLNIVLKSIV